MPNLADKASADWIATLLAELARRTPVYKKLDDYFTGTQGVRFVATGYRQLFSDLFEHYCENVCATVIEYVDDRLDLTGFRFPGVSKQATDLRAWEIWQDNGLDARAPLAHTEAMVKSLAYILVSPFTNERVGPGGRSPRITIEQPSEAIVAYAPGGTERLVGLKHWFDDVVKARRVTLYFPDRIEKYESQGYAWANQYSSGFVESGGWARRVIPGEDWPLKHNLGVVPLIPIVNRPRLGSGMWAGIDGRSDIDEVVPLQDAINFHALNGIVASDKAAFPQKWATGVEIPVDPKTGKQAEDWKPDIDAILSTRAPDAKFGNFDMAELRQYDDAIRTKLEVVALQTRIPVEAFLRQTGQPASGEARETSDAGLTKKINRKQVHMGESWEEAMRLAFRQLGDDQHADDTSCEAEWAYAGIEPSSAKVDALVKERQTLHVPLDVLWERAGYSPSERRTFKEQLEKERDWLNSTPTDHTEPAAVPGPGAIPPSVALAAQGEPTAAPVSAPIVDNAGGPTVP